MRAAALALVVLVVAAPPVEALRLLSSYWSDHPGWKAESFTVDNYPWITISWGIASDSEFIGGVTAFYDNNNAPLLTLFWGSEAGQLVDVSVHRDDIVLNNEDAPGLVSGGILERTFSFGCNTTCNPSRTFKFVGSAGGELESWGYGIFVNNGTKGTSRLGNDSWAVSSRAFDGSIRVQPGMAGVAFAEGATYDLSVQNSLIGAWFKPSNNRPELASIESASLARDCRNDCIFDRLPAGDYQLRYSDVDPGAVESLFIAADVQLP